MKRRVVITGIGVLSPIGSGTREYVRALRAGVSGVGPITLFDASPFPTRIAAEVKEFDPRQFIQGKRILELTDDRRVLLANCATVLALEDALLREAMLSQIRAGVVFGSGIHPVMPTTETIIAQGILYGSEGEMRALTRERGIEESITSPLWNRVDMGTLSVAGEYEIKDFCYTVVSACAASTQAIGQAFRMIQRGEVDLVLTGGYDSMINFHGVKGFSSLGTMSTRNEEPEKAIKPFDRRRDGFVLGEGAGVLILEDYNHARERGVRMYAEVVGYGSSLDAYSVADPHPEGEGAVLSMVRALQDAGMEPEEIEYINAHGTATLKNDKIETAAIKKVFGAAAYRIPVSSTKSMIGHQVAAAGALELIATILAMNNDFMPPTINYETPDPDCDLDYIPNHARDGSFKTALSNSFGFGGQNATLIIRKI